MTTLETLADIEAIKQLKARYFRFLDTEQWDRFASCFTEDCTIRSPVTDDEAQPGRDRFIRRISGNLGPDVFTVHHGHMPEIEIVGPDAATGVWAMYDHLRRVDGSTWDNGFTTLNGWGHYHEQYVRLPDGWRISSMLLTRLRIDFS